MAEAARLLDVLEAIALDVHARATLLEAQCRDLEVSLRYSSSAWRQKRRAADAQQAAQEQEAQLSCAVANAESALEEALQRAKSIRGAVAKMTSSVKEASSSVGPVAPAEQPSVALPRKMVARMKSVKDAALSWRGRDAPPAVVCAKLNQVLAQRDSSVSKIPVRISYRDQLERLTQAYSCIVHVLETKCAAAVYPSAMEDTPKLPTVFPLWYRLNKVKQLLAALNDELAACIQRLPPPPTLSKRAADRSKAFLLAIQKNPMATVDNATLACSNEAHRGIYTKLQASWERDENPLVGAPNYIGCVDQLACEQVCKQLVPFMQQLGTATSATADSLRLLRLIHSLTCCEGLEIRSVVALA
ncbi:hypothetical protein ACHHYP_07942 [Achlya hypogyna]|uniref:Uncharacterized protein n=1 Tax=Achlya hypogyna TaxID=1202772 RepID=A0A1V9YQG6_ACHHY|nr:hypothetical protein ACHHYP_07942 [Achlya hypogyna]